MKKRKQTHTHSEFYTPQTYKNIICFNGFFFILLLGFSILLILTFNLISTTFGSTPLDENEILSEYVTASLPTNADNLFTEHIDRSMEEQFNSSVLTNFYFSTNNYPFEEGLIPYIETALTDYVDNAEFISGAVVYASTTNTYITSNNYAPDNDPKTKGFMDTMIYAYNSNTLKRTQIPDRKSNTFLFQYEENIVLSKDLTTLAGTPHAIMFVFLDMDALSSSIYHSITSVPYKVSIFDANSNKLYSNSDLSSSTLADYLTRLSVSDNPLERKGNLNFIYCHSNILGFQYILEIQRDAISKTPEHPVMFFSISVLAIVLISLFMCILIFFTLGIPMAQLFSTFCSPETVASILPPKAFRVLTKQINSTVQENLALRKIVAVTSSEAVTSLFSRLIAGHKLEEEEIKITLENTDFGFRPDDIYIAGILYHSGQDFLNVENRHRILNFLNETFKEFKKTNDVNICSFLYDDRTIAIVASFVYGISIAKGKAKINALKEQINETMGYSSIPMMLAFGNMYSSILDLSFSYNEAFRGIHYMIEAASVSTNAAASVLPATLEDNSKFDESHSMKPKANDTAAVTDSNQEDVISPQDFLELIYRRAEQIAKLVWDEKEDQVMGLIERTVEDIIKVGTFPEQTNNCKRLISAVTSHMLSYPFVSDTHLSDVYNQLALQLEGDVSSSNDLKAAVRNALLILCNDFAEALKKQRNPYILAAQEYIKHNYGNPELTLESIAEQLKIAPNYLSTIFSKNLGKRLFEYINEYRLEKSIVLLLSTNKSINDIGVESGFGSSRNYIRIFKKIKGMPPGAYRKQHQEQQTSRETGRYNHEDNGQ